MKPGIEGRLREALKLVDMPADAAVECERSLDAWGVWSDDLGGGLYFTPDVCGADDIEGVAAHLREWLDDRGRVVGWLSRRAKA